MGTGITLECIGWPTVHLERVMALHRANTKTLGFLPKGAFEENAKLGQIIIALDAGGVCIGYGNMTVNDFRLLTWNLQFCRRLS